MTRRACALLVLSVAMPAYAHHSAAGLDRTRTIILTGTVKRFGWVNPHSWIEIEVSSAKGGVEVWNISMTAPRILAKAGWKSNAVKPGDKISLTVHPLLTGEPGGVFVSLILPDGTIMTERNPPVARKYPSGRP